MLQNYSNTLDWFCAVPCCKGFFIGFFGVLGDNLLSI